MPRSPDPGPLERQRIEKRLALNVVLVYAALAVLWIYGSDWLLFQLVSDPGWQARIATFKGWFFVTWSGLLIYVGIRRAFRRRPALPRPSSTCGRP